MNGKWIIVFEDDEGQQQEREFDTAEEARLAGFKLLLLDKTKFVELSRMEESGRRYHVTTDIKRDAKKAFKVDLGYIFYYILHATPTEVLRMYDKLTRGNIELLPEFIDQLKEILREYPVDEDKSVREFVNKWAT